MTFLIFIAVFVCVACLVGGVAIILRPPGDSMMEDRLQVLTGKKGKPGEAAKDDGPMFADAMAGADKATQFLSKIGNLNLLLDQAEAGLDARKFLLLTGGLAAVGVVVPVVLRLPFYVIPIAVGILSILPLGFVLFKRKQRLQAFSRQLPDALELISRALRAGHSLGAAFHLVATEMANPIRAEFHRSYEEQNLGKPLEETLQSMTDRVPNMDLQFFATAVVLQRTTGGDLAEILDKIGHLIRERFKIWGQIQSLTGEGRLSGIVLLALPPVLFVVMYRMNPDYVMMLFRDPMGQQMLAGAVVMQFIGALVIKKIINIKV